MYKVFCKETNKEIENAAIRNDGFVLVPIKDRYHIMPKDSYRIEEYPVPNLNEFRKLILAMQENDKRQDQLNEALSKVCIDSILYFPTLKQEILDYLKYTFGDENDWIGYFVCELDYGKEWKPGTVTSEDGADIPIGTIEELYAILIDNLS